MPPPRYPLTRFYGVLAPRAKLRPRIVPKLPPNAASPCASPPATGNVATSRSTDRPKERPRPRERDGDVVPAALPVAAGTLALALGVAADVPAPNVLSASHMDRIAGSLLYAASSNVPWATLLARTFDVDIKSCARCAGRLEVRAVVTDPIVARKILDAMPAAARAPPSTLDSTLVYEPAFAQRNVSRRRPAPFARRAGHNFGPLSRATRPL